MRHMTGHVKSGWHWLELLEAEKELTQCSAELARQRHELPEGGLAEPRNRARLAL
jgi:predicted dithiol-disulfide oxidoreductase (DUF899 family)